MSESGDRAAPRTHQSRLAHTLARLAGSGYPESISPRRGKEAADLRIAFVPALVASLAVMISACGSGEGSSKIGITPPVPTPSPAVEPTATVAPVTEVQGLIYPIEGACLPTSDDLMPNAPRQYRGGIHQGVDFYGYDNCVSIVRGTPVRAAKAGRVVRATWNYHDLTADELQSLNERVAQGEANDPDILDTYRGRQVWVDHGGGLVTRYAHLEGIATGIDVGVTVEVGQELGYVGDSGTPESVTAPDTENHLHFEIWVGGHFLGQDLPPGEVRALYEKAFSLGPASDGAGPAAE